MNPASTSHPVRQDRAATIARDVWTTLGPVLVVSVAAVVLAATGMRGSDYPAHEFRGELWRSSPLGTWNFEWYGGHSTFAYTVLTPPLVSVIGAFGLCVASSIVAVGLGGRLIVRHTGRLAAATGTFTIAVMAVDNMVVGRVPFALGYAVAVAVLLLWSHGRTAAAATTALVVALASPVAAVMLGLVVLAVAIDAVVGARHTRSFGSALAAARNPLLIGSATGAPLLIMLAVSTRSTSGVGHFPYASKYIIFSIATTTVVLIMARRRVVRIGAAVALVFTIVVAIVPNPLGGNFVRFTSFVILPVATAMATQRLAERAHAPRSQSDRLDVNLLASALVVAAVWAAAVGFSLTFGIKTIGNWRHDPTQATGYFDPMLAELASAQRGEPLTRLEIPFTRGHRESDVVATRAAYARGWERQIDLTRNSVLYDEDLTEDEYREWIDDMAVGFVAVPNAPLDVGGRPEARLIDDGVDWLSLVWSSDDWRLYRVEQPTPITSSDATSPGATTVDATGIGFEATSAGTVEVSAVYDQRLTIVPSGCLTPDEDGHIVAHIDQPGQYRIEEAPFAIVSGIGGSCAP